MGSTSRLMGTCGSTDENRPDQPEQSEDADAYWNVISGRKSMWNQEEEDVFKLTERRFRPKLLCADAGADTNQLHFQMMEKGIDAENEWDSFVRIETLTKAGASSTYFWRVRIVDKDGVWAVLEHKEY